MKAKKLKAQFNDLCIGGMILDMNRVAVYSGLNGMNLIEVSQHGINIQTELGKPIVLNSLNIQGVGYKELITPADFLPFAHITLPRKTIAPISGIVDQFKGIVQVGTLLLSSGV